MLSLPLIVMDPTLPPAPFVPPAPFKNRRAALIVAGILEILMGLAAFGLVALIFVSFRMAAAQGGVSMASFIPGALTYGAAGIIFVCLGIGSLMARRWARALWVVLSIGWLAIGILSFLFLIIWLPSFLRNVLGAANAPPNALTIALVVACGLVGVFMVLLPLALLLFYRGRNVRRTCEAAQPEADWTDRCPLPVLSAAMWIGTLAVLYAAIGFAYGGMFPFFGQMIHGWPGVILWLVMAAAIGGAAVGLYRGRMDAWWSAMALLVILAVSSVVTYLHVDISEFYAAMGLQGPQMAQLEQMGLMSRGYLIWSSLGMLVPYLALLAWALSALRRR